MDKLPAEVDIILPPKQTSFECRGGHHFAAEVDVILPPRWTSFCTFDLRLN
ncbi:MAG: hypothetical protein AAFN08_07855 [Cyanobacteria bacterium J06559_3]